MGLRIRHTANKKVCTNHSLLSLSHIDQTIWLNKWCRKERPFHLQCYYNKKKFQALKMDRKAILAVVKAIMKNIAQKHHKLISFCFFVVVTIILQCFHQNCDISPYFLWPDHTCRIISSNRKCIDHSSVLWSSQYSLILQYLPLSNQQSNTSVTLLKTPLFVFDGMVMLSTLKSKSHNVIWNLFII